MFFKLPYAEQTYHPDHEHLQHYFFPCLLLVFIFSLVFSQTLQLTIADVHLTYISKSLINTEPAR